MPQLLPDKVAAARDALGYDEVGWYPLTMMIAAFIDGMVEEGELRIKFFTVARDKPSVLDAIDEATIDQALRIHHERLHFIKIWSEQLRRWRTENPDPEQCREIDRLEIQISKLRKINTQVFRLGAKILKEKSDLDLSPHPLILH
jgi:hypothetical protein